MPKASTAQPRASRMSGVRARTRKLLLDAAVRVFARKGVGATAIHEIAAEAGVANGTFYNYFRAREEIVEAVGHYLAQPLHDEIGESSTDVSDPAERVAIGSRRFILKAMRDPSWGAAIVRVSGGSPGLPTRTAAPVLADLRAGRRRGRFRFTSESAAVDLLQGAVLAAMRTILEGRAGEEHAADVAALILRGLGVEAGEADAIARRPLPALTPGKAAARAKGATRSRRTVR
jgi:AcrR family transcriptional regulator